MKKKQNILFYFLVFIISILIFALVLNLTYPYIWFDEASQFWISKGLNPDSDPFSKTGNIVDVIINNRHYNFDPGGFSILLHFWAKVSNHSFWLRLLPFTFFLLSLVFLVKLFYKRWIRNRNVVLALIILPIFFPMLLDLAFEIRAYSMEILGAILCLYSMEEIKFKMSRLNLFKWSITLSIFLTSRYSLLIIAFLSSLYIIWYILKQPKTAQYKFQGILLYSIPLLITISCIYFFTLFYQNSNLQPLHYLPFLKNSPGLLLRPFNLAGVFVTGGLGVMLLVRERFYIIKKYESLLYLSFFVNISFLILSFTGLHPWSFYTHRCIAMIFLNLICILVFAGEFLSIFLKKKETIAMSLIAGVIVLLIIWRADSLFPRYYSSTKTLQDLKSLKIEGDNYLIYADRKESPSIKYLFEYGDLKSFQNHFSYPNNFYLQKAFRHSFNEGRPSKEEWYNSQPTMNDLIKYNVLITPELFKMKPRKSSNKWKFLEGSEKVFVKVENTMKESVYLP